MSGVYIGRATVCSVCGKKTPALIRCDKMGFRLITYNTCEHQSSSTRLYSYDHMVLYFSIRYKGLDKEELMYKLDVAMMLYQQQN